MNALRSSTVEFAISGAVNIEISPIITYFSQQYLSYNPHKAPPVQRLFLSRTNFSPADKRRAEFFVDLPDFFYAVDVRLVNAFRPAAAAVIASGAELAVNPACAPESLVNNADSFFPCGIFDQYGAHSLTSPFYLIYSNLRLLYHVLA